MKPRIILILLTIAMLAVTLGLWLASTSTEQEDGQNGQFKVASSKPTKVVSNTTSPTLGKRAQIRYTDLENGEPNVTFTDLTLDEANAVLAKLVGEVMPPGTRMVRPGHMKMKSEDAKKLIKKIEVVRNEENERQYVFDGVVKPSKWIEFNKQVLKQPRKSDRVQVEFPVGTVVFTMTSESLGPIPRYNLWIDPASGLCVFSKMSNYDP